MLCEFPLNEKKKEKKIIKLAPPLKKFTVKVW